MKPLRMGAMTLRIILHVLLEYYFLYKLLACGTCDMPISSRLFLTRIYD